MDLCIGLGEGLTFGAFDDGAGRAIDLIEPAWTRGEGFFSLEVRSTTSADMPIPMSGKGATVLVSLTAGCVVTTGGPKVRECAAEDGSSIIGAGGAANRGAGMGVEIGAGAGAGTGTRAARKFSRSRRRTDLA